MIFPPNGAYWERLNQLYSGIVRKLYSSSASPDVPADRLSALSGGLFTMLLRLPARNDRLIANGVSA